MREQYIKKLIKEQGETVKSFAKSIEMPYSTLLSILKDGAIGGASVDNVMRICKGLNINVDDLQPLTNKTTELSTSEWDLLDNYRDLNEDGRDKASEYVSDLVATGRYKKHNQPRTNIKNA